MCIRDRDAGVHMPLRVWTDSESAMGTAGRQGLGKLRHLETHTLWLQEKVRTGAIKVRNVSGEVNPADLFTKYLPSGVKIAQLVKLFGCEYREGRSAAAPLLRPADKLGGQDGQPSDSHLPTFPINETTDYEAEIHDETVLPHMYAEYDIDRMFPLIPAADAAENVEDWQPVEQRMEHGGDSAVPAKRSWPRPIRPPGSKQ